MEFCISDLIAQIAGELGDRQAFVTPEFRTGWRDFDRRVSALAAGLHAAGLRCHGDVADVWGRHARTSSAQDHVGILSGNRPEYIETMVGAFRARLVPVNMNYRYTADELAYLIDNADLRAIVYESRYGPALAEAMSKSAAVEVLVCLPDSSTTAPVPRSLDYRELVAGTSDTSPADSGAMSEPTADDRYILYTGGTTGFPKGVIWRQEDWFMAALNGAARGFKAPEEVVRRAVESRPLPGLPASPFMHGAGHWAAFNILLQGGTVVFPPSPDRLDPHAIWHTVERERVVLLQVVGDAFLGPLIEALTTGDYDVSCLRFLVTSGAIASPARKVQLLQHIPTLRIIDAIGASESGGTAIATGTRAEPAPEFELETSATVLHEDNLGIADVGEEGLLAQADYVPLGYYKDPEKTEETFPIIGGVRYSVPGDHAVRLSGGKILLLGRGSQCINTGGEKVFPEEVEQTLKGHGAVSDALVAGVPDDRWGEVVGAVVALRPGARATAAQLAVHLREHLAGYKIPKRWVIGSEPVCRNHVGKPDYAWARRMLDTTS